MDRRTFLQGLGGSALAAATWGWPGTSLAARTDSAEALSIELLRGLTDVQRAAVAFPWDEWAKAKKPET